MSAESDYAAELRGLIKELDRQMAGDMPLALRQEAERGRAIALQALRIAEQPESAYLAAWQDELAEAFEKVPRPLRGTATLEEASRYVHIRRDVEPWEVWVRWDEIPPKARDTVQVLANLWRDILKGRARAGRPKKSSN